MHKVVGINLNGNAYQLEEPGYEALRAYLERADGHLQVNPDRAEIMADLEQAIAEKCGGYLSPSKTVVTAAEIETIISEMGPVESPEASAKARSSAEPNAGAAQPEAGTRKHRRLYQMREGAMLSGVCNGLAAFLDIDVTVVRLLFVIITFATFGAWILAYILMAIFIPYADTPDDRAAAYGLRLKAQEFLDQARQHQGGARARREWRRNWRRQQRAWQRNWSEKWQRQWDQRWQQHMTQAQAAMGTGGAAPMPVVGHFLAGLSLPVFAIINAALFVTWILVILSAVTTGTIFGWSLPAELPLWASLLILFAIYIAVVSPLSAARHGARNAWGPYYAPWAAVSGLFWVGATVLFFWLAYQHIPEVHALIEQLPSFWQKRQTVLAALGI